MKRLFNIIFSTCALAVLTLTGCDKISVDDMGKYAPEIASFSPEEGGVGAEVVVTGSNLNDVVSATIGGEEVIILQRISNKQLILTVTKDAKSGPLVLTNAQGSTSSTTPFTCLYAVPQLDVQSLPAEAELGGRILLSGENLNVVNEVQFTAEGYTKANVATIISQSKNELLVLVPYVESADARITLTYFDGSKNAETQKSDAPKMTIIRKTPVFEVPSLGRTAVGKSVTLTGENLDKVNNIKMGDAECPISVQTANKLVFSVPASNFVDGDNFAVLTATYFDNHETIVIEERMNVFVPYVKFWEDCKAYGQGRDVENMASFFSPETGIVYANSDWRTLVDPISYKYGANTCSANNKPAVSADEYNSVNPYFFFTGVNAGQLQINSPAGSASQLKNIYFENNSANDYRVTGASSNWYGTPVLTYCYLADDKYPELVSKIKSQTLENIDESTFPIDEVNGKVGDITFSSFKSTVNSDVWAPGKFTAGVEAANVQVDGVLMVLYFNNEGVNIANIKRIGFVHIKFVNFKMWNNTKAPSSSDVTFNTYWMKYDYDYSK